ncbi:probable glycosyltransferase At5g03795 [Ipomoea triloba]|uniref:probable glycosyltransferase At5g03795 n=1 Tax=Ipomoea triloba TaxID=35885 RepID=UPI00125D1541|nr:probable glycosyltransferase At5g03795 [Ipomoea triloba]XP_031109875.1 probable glycosyltransferase At5g03795 [Ipomoea triloba]XP_031109876.1 probable glycosyltransferase At5g03795 [Ipomoea triloba]
MMYTIDFQKLCEIDRRKWILVLSLVAITHLFCQTLMLPYGDALLSLLPDNTEIIHQKVSLSFKESSLKSVSLDEPVRVDGARFANLSLLPTGVENTDGGDDWYRVKTRVAGQIVDDGEKSSSIVNEKSLDNDFDFVEDATLDNDNPFEEIEADEELKVRSGINQEHGSVRPPSEDETIENSNELSTVSRDPLVSSRSSLSNSGISPRNSSKSGEQNLSLPNGRNVVLLQPNMSTTTTNPGRKKMRCEMPPKSVMYISQMERLLVRHRARSRAARPRWSSERDKDILAAKLQIENAPLLKTDQELYAPVFRNISMFKRSYELMESTLKIYVYKEGAKPIFHQPILKGLYASEGWFMKLMERNRKYVVKDPRKAHLFYMPFSSRMLEYTLYVRNSHDRTNLRQYLKDYSERIAAKYRFWNRTGGADHFLVACHDWAPYETRHHMEHCIKALCNADVTAGFKIGRDVSLPETYIRSQRNPLRDLGGKPPSQRRILAFYAGNMHGYLRPILLEHWKDRDPEMKIFGPMPPGVASKMSYIQHMKSSKFCICPKGYEVNSPRVVEAIYYECVPVIVSDNFVPPFFDVLNWDAFSIIVAEKDIPNLKDILLSVTEQKYLQMQVAVRKVQQHFLWHVKPQKYDLFHMTLHSIWYNRVFQVKAR